MENKFSSMNYIQRFKTRNKGERNEAGLTRFLSVDYMGSAEFEFGAYGKTIRFLRATELELQAVNITHNDKTVKFWVISNSLGIERFKETILNVVTGKTWTKEWTDLYAPFSSGDKTNVAAWLDITPALNNNAETSPPVFFTLSKEIATQAFLEISRSTTTDWTPPELNIFDKVYIPWSRHGGRIVGIHEDGSFTVKIFHVRHKKVSIFDIWPKEKFPIDRLNAGGLDFKHGEEHAK